MDKIKQAMKLILQYIGAILKAAVKALEANTAKAEAARQQIQQQTRMMQEQQQQAITKEEAYHTMMRIAEELYMAIGSRRYNGAIEIEKAADLRIKRYREEPPLYAFYYYAEKPSNFRLQKKDLAYISEAMNTDILRQRECCINQFGEQQSALMFPHLFYGLKVVVTMDTGYEIVLRVTSPLYMTAVADSRPAAGESVKEQ